MVDKNNIDSLLNDIERYFNCELSENEESRLRRQIAQTQLRHPAVDEIRALMGIRSRRRKLNFRPVMAACSVAASLALVVSIGVSLLSGPSNSFTSDCVAYVDGERITDEEAVLRLTIGNLAEFESGHEEVKESMIEDFRGIASAIDEFEIDGDPFIE